MITVLRLTMSELQVQCHLLLHRPLPLQQMPVHMAAVVQLTGEKVEVISLLEQSNTIRIQMHNTYTI